MKRNRIRVLHCPTMTGLHPQGLARAERALGLDSWSVSFEPGAFHGYYADEVIWTPNASLFRLGIRWLRLLWRAGRDFDVIHYNAGESLIPRPNVKRGRLPFRHCPAFVERFVLACAALMEMRDVAWLKSRGKVIVVTFQGDDARQADYCRSNFDIHFEDEVESDYSSPDKDRKKRWRIDRFNRYADLMYAVNPDLLHVLPARARFLSYANTDYREWPPKRTGSSGVPVILHAPSHRGVKGTRFVESAFSRLQAEGVPFTPLLVENTPFDKARLLYEKADLLVDQVLAGWYGGLAVELMALGRPVMCYLRTEDLKFVPESMQLDLPIINVNPDTLYDVLKEWLTIRRYELPKAGAQSRAYVEKWHDPLQIAKMMKAEYEKALGR